jgi:uncharacterized protein (TIGR04222 family)
MARKIFSAILICILLAAFVTTVALADKSYQADRFDVQLDLQPDGSMLVTETVLFRFEGGPFTYVFRNLSQSGTDGIQVLEASMDGVTFQPGKDAGQVEIAEGDPIKVTWHFNPLSDSTHEFVLHYRVNGVIRTGAADTLLWYAIPEEHDYSIALSNVSINYPPAVRPLETPSLNRNFESAPTDQGIRLTTRGISDNESVILTAKFPSGSLVSTPPVWQVQQAQESAATNRVFPIGLIAGLATLVLGTLGLFLYIRANHRDLNLPARTPLAVPPADVPPAVIGKLTGYEAYSSMGAIFALAQRGVLEIREEKGFWGSKAYILERKEGNFSLNQHEQGLLDAIIKPGETRVNMSEITTRLAYKKNSFYEPLEQDLIQRGWFDPERKRVRTTLAVTGLLIMVAAMLVFILSMALAGVAVSRNAGWLAWTAAVAGTSASLFLLSIVLLIYAGTFSILTPAGEEQSIRWKGFAEYLKLVSKGKEPAIRPDYFELYLAYAAVFGLGAGWAKYFQKFGGVPLPVWFHAMPGSNGDFGAIVAIMSASDSAGASTGADGDGGGASGGGSSGAG